MLEPSFKKNLNLVVVISITMAILGGLAWAHLLAPQSCQESAFQGSTVSATAAREYFEVQLEPQSGILPRLTYLISLQEVPLVRVQASALGCRVVGEQQLSIEEIDEILSQRTI